MKFSNEFSSFEVWIPVSLVKLPLQGEMFWRWFIGKPPKMSNTSGCFSRQTKIWRDEWKFSKSRQTNVLLGSAPPGCKLSQDQPWKTWLVFYPTHNNPGVLSLHHKQTRENWVCFPSAERRKTQERNLFSLLTSKHSWTLKSGFLFFFLIYVHDGSCKAFPPHSLDFSRSLVENIIFSNVHQKWIWSYTSYTVVSIWTYTLLS